MLVNIDICGDILIQAETDFERDYVHQFEGCNYSAFVKRGLTPAEVIGLKLRKTSDTAELAATAESSTEQSTANIQSVPCVNCGKQVLLSSIKWATCEDCADI